MNSSSTQYKEKSLTEEKDIPRDTTSYEHRHHQYVLPSWRSDTVSTHERKGQTDREVNCGVIKSQNEHVTSESQSVLLSDVESNPSVLDNIFSNSPTESDFTLHRMQQEAPGGQFLEKFLGDKSPIAPHLH
jgi:hypothetical protein